MSRDGFKNKFQEWGGIISNADPHDIPLGSMVEMDNLEIRRAGALDVRKGGTRLNTRVASDDIISQFTFRRPEGEWIVWETSTGKVKAIKVSSPSTTLTLGTGYNTFQPICFAQDRYGVLFGVNGIDRPFRWDGMTAALEDAGIDAPTDATLVTVTAAAGNATAGVYKFAARYLDDDIDYDEFDSGTVGGYPSNFGDLQSVTAVANDRFNWDVAASSQSRVTRTQLWRTTAGQTNRFYLVTTLATNGGTYSDTLSDTALAANQGISLLTADGTRAIARRFTPPPNHKPYIAFLQDRAFYAGCVKYTTGTASISSGSPTLSGSGTAWTSQMVGRNVYINGSAKPYRISAYSSATSLTLSENAAANISGATYVIAPPADELNKLIYSEVDNASAVPIQNEIILQQNTADPDEITGIAPQDTALLVGQQRHLYTLRFVRQPDIDASVSLIARRGLINNRCWSHIEGTIFLMDSVGPYSVSGGISNIGEPIQDKWKNATVSGPSGVSKWWFTHGDPAQEYVRFFYHISTDTNTRPSRFYQFNTRLGKWTHGTYKNEIGGASVITTDGVQLSVYGALNDTLIKSEQGSADIVTSATTGTATAGGASTLTDSGASFTDAMLDAPLAITSGTGKGQIRRITARSSTQLTVDSAWDTQPDTTSTYSVGAIKWQLKTGIMEMGGRGVDDEYHTTQAMSVVYKPVTNTAYLNIKRYEDQSTTAVANITDQRLGDYVVIEAGGDAVINMKLAVSELENNNGRAYYEFGGHTNQRAVGDYFCQFEMYGFQDNDNLAIYDLTLYSIE